MGRVELCLHDVCESPSRMRRKMRCNLQKGWQRIHTSSRGCSKRKICAWLVLQGFNASGQIACGSFYTASRMHTAVDKGLHILVNAPSITSDYAAISRDIRQATSTQGSTQRALGHALVMPLIWLPQHLSACPCHEGLQARVCQALPDPPADMQPEDAHMTGDATDACSDCSKQLMGS